MKIIKLTVIVLLTFTALSFVKSGKSFNIVQALPFADGDPVNIYHWGSLAILLITLWGYFRMNRDHENDNSNEFEINTGPDEEQDDDAEE